MFNQIENYNNNIFSGINALWTVINNEPLRNKIKTLNKRNKL